MEVGFMACYTIPLLISVTRPRPANVLLHLKSLDGLDRQEVYDILGEPETAKVVLRDASKIEVQSPEVPQYLVRPVDFESLEVGQLDKQIYITDFGQSFDATRERTQKTGIPRPYSPPELVFDKAAGIPGDLWSLACLIFECRMGTKIIEPADIVGPNDEEYILTVTLILGKLPAMWWNYWGRGDHFYESNTLGTHGELTAKPGKISNDNPLVRVRNPFVRKSQPAAIATSGTEATKKIKIYLRKRLHY
jgi:serine/threonine protein kinase